MKNIINKDFLKKIKINEGFLLSIAALILGFIGGAIFMMISGKDPAAAYFYLYRGASMTLERIGNSLAQATPLLLAGLAVAFAFKTGLFNIGVPGQMFMGGFAAFAVAFTLRLPFGLTQILAVLAAAVVGGLWASISGFLKAKFEVNEVVVNIMLNLTASWIVYYLVGSPTFASARISETANIPEINSLRLGWLSKMFNNSYINGGIFIAIIATLVVYYILEHTTFGYELKAVGLNRYAAKYAGMKVQRKFIQAMAISGVLAGLAGATLYIGYGRSVMIGLPSQGYDAIAISLIGQNNPFGVLATAILFGFIYVGKGYMSAMADLPPEITNTIIAIIVYFSATSLLLKRIYLAVIKIFKKKAKEEI